MSTLAFQPLGEASEAQRLRPSGVREQSGVHPALVRPTVRIGVLLDADLTPEERAGIPPVLARLSQTLGRTTPGVCWRVGEVRGRAECAVVRADGGLSQLDSAVEALETSRLDFAIVVVADALEDHRGQPVSVLSSQPLSCAVACIARNGSRGEQRAIELEHRLLHVVAHLTQASTGQPLEEMQRPQEILPAQQRLAFYARALARNARDVLAGVQCTRPWLLPLRLPRLTAGAVVATALTMLSAEAWQLSASQSSASLLSLCALTLLGATLYLLVCQHPLRMLRRHRLGERRVRAEAVTCLGLATGLTALATASFACCLALALGFYPAELIGHWTGSVSPTAVCVKMATLSTALGIVIAALGASLEPNARFRFALLVDDAPADER